MGIGSWQDDLRPASFRGIPFFVEAAGIDGGRKTVRHEYPFRDVSFVEDMGRRARDFPVEAYVLGADYFTDRDALWEALERGPSFIGPATGELVHPYYGTLQVVVDTFHVRENVREGGIARFSIVFRESAIKPAAPARGIVFLNPLADLAAATSFTSLRKFFKSVARFSKNVSATIATAKQVVNNVLAPVVLTTQALATVKNQLDNLALDADSIARDPFVLGSRLKAVLDNFLTLPATPRLSLDALLKAYGFAPGTDPGNATAASRQAQVNRIALKQFLDQMTVINAAQVAATLAASPAAPGQAVPGFAFDSFEQAQAAQDSITAKLDEQSEATPDDDVFLVLQNLRAALVTLVPGDANALLHVASVTPRLTVPSLVLTYNFYGDLDNELDVCARNAVPHPGFLRGGQPLSVLSRA